MTFRFNCGLVVGKFAPLHRGHQLVIDTALEQCREVVLLSYCDPEIEGHPPELRERWLAELYPQALRYVVTNDKLAAWYPNESCVMPPNDADDETHREFMADLLRHVIQREVDAVFSSESYGDGFAAHLTRYFRRWNSAAKPVRHISVDYAREVVPISGRVIRADVHSAKQWLHPAVYASFVQRIVCLGGESSGKSTLAAALAEQFNTLCAAEFGREWWMERGGQLSFDDLLFIGRKQVEREEQLARGATRYLFCDTSPLTTLFYCLDQFGLADPHLEALAARRYDLTLLCAPDFPFVQDGTRREPEFRMRQHEWYVREMKRRGVAYLEVRGDVEGRVREVRDTLAGHSQAGPEVIGSCVE